MFVCFEMRDIVGGLTGNRIRITVSIQSFDNISVESYNVSQICLQPSVKFHLHFAMIVNFERDEE